MPLFRALLIVAAGFSCLGLSAQPSRQPMVVLISLDAFGAEALHDPLVPAPNLRALMKTGAFASAMRPINPTVTWPNHTSMVTGVDASRHFVMANGLIVHQREPGQKPSVDFPSTKTALVHVPTIYDAAHAAGLTTAEVDWVAIHDPHTIDFAFEENPDAGSLIVREMLASGELTQHDLDTFRKGFQPHRDQLYTAAAVHILRQHHPNLLLLHYLALDSAEHAYGFGSQAAANAISFLDAQVRLIEDAVREAGDLDRTTFLIVSDHGQSSVARTLKPEVLLHSAVLPPGEAAAVPEGGVAYIYLKHAGAEEVAAVRAAFEGKEGIDSVVSADAFGPLGIAPPSTNPESPDLLVFLRPGYSAVKGDSGPAVAAEPAPTGSHGYLNTLPLMQQIFIANGRGIQNAGSIGPITVLDVAPTIAALLGLRMDKVQGKVLQQILK